MLTVDRRWLLRQQYKNKRLELTKAIWGAQSHALCGELSRWSLFKQARIVLAYHSLAQEPDLSQLWQAFPEKIWGLPRCDRLQLVFHQVDVTAISTELMLGKWGIWEPRSNLPLISLDQVDLVLVPALACDRQGVRLGYGGGFYDRFFSKFPELSKVGVVFNDCIVDKLPKATWDVPMQFLATESIIMMISG